MTLPAAVDGKPLETWAIERFFGGYHGPDYREAVVTAIESGRNAVEALRAVVQWGGVLSPGKLPVMWDQDGIAIWPDYRRQGEPAMRITIGRIVERVTNELAGQTTLF